MVNLEMSIKFNGSDEILVSNSPDNRNNVEIGTLLFHLYKISNKRIIFKANGNQLSVWTDIKRKWLPIIISPFDSLSHLQSLKIEESHIVVIACCNQVENAHHITLLLLHCIFIQLNALDIIYFVAIKPHY